MKMPPSHRWETPVMAAMVVGVWLGLMLAATWAIRFAQAWP